MKRENWAAKTKKRRIRRLMGVMHLSILFVAASALFLSAKLLRSLGSPPEEKTYLMTSSNIPQVIWQTAKSHKPTLAAKIIMDTWEKKNPLWTQELLDDDELLTFMSTYFNQTAVDAFKRFPMAVMRADFFRIAVMLHKGGIYADVDVDCKLPIDQWDNGAIEKCDVVIGLEYDFDICNWGFASKKGHPLFKKAVELSLSRFIDAGVDYTHEQFVQRTTGPALLTDAVRFLLDDESCEPPPEEKAKDRPFYAKAIYDNCREKLKEEHGICLYDEVTLKTWFDNNYASQKPEFQSKEWMSSWIQERDIMIKMANQV